MNFDLIVFAAEAERAREAMEAGASAVLVDWESADKEARQRGADTEINRFGPRELRNVREAVSGPVICRINGMHAGSRAEIESALDCGANEIFLPMVRTVEEASRFIEWVGGRARPSILIETRDAVRRAPELGRLPLARIYVGLTDLGIDLGSPSLFTPVAEGMVDDLRPHVGTSFGFGGLTVPERGAPIPCVLLMSEMIRLRCDFTFLRRSFWRDASDIGVAEAIARIRRGLDETATLDSRALEDRRRRFQARVTSIAPAGPRGIPS